MRFRHPVLPPRQFLLIVCLLFSAVPAAAQSADDIETHLPALHEVFADHFSFGVFLSYPHIGLPDDPPVPGQGSVVSPNGGYLVKHHMNFMAPGNNMKAQNTVNIAASAQAYNAAATEAERDSINVNPVVRFNGNMIAQLNWAQRHGFSFRGHTLVWHNQTPGTAFFRTGYSADGERLSPELMTERMRNYIREVIRLLHEGWPGMVTAMDVVNEKILGNGADRTDGNEWYTTFGDMSYVRKAFEFARQAAEEFGETQMKLYYNDYNTHQAAKADGIVRLLTPIFEDGYLDGIGMQHHDQWNAPTAQQWIASYDKFDAVSHEMAVTELDVNPQMTTPTATRLIQQANQYAMFFKLYMDRSHGSGSGKIVNVTKDGLNDEFAFVRNASLWDAENQAKPAYYAVADVGIYYALLDALIAYAAELDETEYSAETWSAFSVVYDDARFKMDRNYSYMESAADALKNAHYALLDAIEQLDADATDAFADSDVVTARLTLHQNYPNPFNPTTAISFTLRGHDEVRLDVLDVLGRRVATLVDRPLPAGSHTVMFDAGGLAGGVYVYQLHTKTATLSRTMHVVK